MSIYYSNFFPTSFLSYVTPLLYLELAFQSLYCFSLEIPQWHNKPEVCTMFHFRGLFSLSLRRPWRGVGEELGYCTNAERLALINTVWGGYSEPLLCGFRADNQCLVSVKGGRVGAGRHSPLAGQGVTLQER